ncbi:MAG: thiamine-binding protein [Christensenellales bacterium]|jgi:uncharacterized protein (TIGR00106 family)
MPMINLELQVVPGGVNDVYAVVDKVIALIQKSGVNYEVGPMGTTMEGELPVLLDIVQQAQQVCIDSGASRVMSVIKIDYKPEGVTMDEKIAKYRN